MRRNSSDRQQLATSLPNQPTAGAAVLGNVQSMDLLPIAIKHHETAKTDQKRNAVLVEQRVSA